MAYAHLLVDRDGDCAVVTINRPQVLNALNRATVAELDSVMQALGHDAAVRCIIVTGAGEKAFVAGADISELAQLSPEEGRSYAEAGQRVLMRIERLGKPVIAAVNGFALGGGCELAMACTLRLASETARFGQPEIRLGLIPGFGGTQRLARLIGRGRAIELLLTGRMVEASEAQAIGLVHKVVAPSALMTEARDLARTLAAQAPLAARYAIEAIVHGVEVSLDEAMVLEAGLFGLAAASEDGREGTAAFLEKRKPSFRGR